MEIGVFEAVPPKGSIGIEELAIKCDAEASLIGQSPLRLTEIARALLIYDPQVRLMRQLTCVGLFKEVKVSEWSHTPQTFVMSNHAGMTGKYFFEVRYVTPHQTLPSLLQEERTPHGPCPRSNPISPLS